MGRCVKCKKDMGWLVSGKCEDCRKYILAPTSQGIKICEVFEESEKAVHVTYCSVERDLAFNTYKDEWVEKDKIIEYLKN